MLNRTVMRTFMRAILLALPLFATAGCATYEWHKDGADAGAARALLDSCSLKARSEAARRIQATPPAPNIAVDRQGRTVILQPPDRDGERFLLEQDLIRRCMTGAGYTLQAVDRKPSR